MRGEKCEICGKMDRLEECFCGRMVCSECFGIDVCGICEAEAKSRAAHVIAVEITEKIIREFEKLKGDWKKGEKRGEVHRDKVKGVGR